MKTLTFLCLLCVIATLGYAGCGTATICNFGCCPFPFATCCKGWKACCPHGMTCDGIAKKCFNTEKFEVVDMFFA